MNQVMGGTLERGLGQVTRCQLRLVLQPGLRGTVVKVTRRQGLGVVHLMLPQGV